MRISKGIHADKEIAVISYALRRPRQFALLSASELDVVESVLHGRSQAEVAQRHEVSSRTVANQLASAYAKLGIGSIVELSVLCSEWSATKEPRGLG